MDQSLTIPILKCVKCSCNTPLYQPILDSVDIDTFNLDSVDIDTFNLDDYNSNLNNDDHVKIRYLQ